MRAERVMMPRRRSGGTRQAQIARQDRRPGLFHRRSHWIVAACLSTVVSLTLAPAAISNTAKVGPLKAISAQHSLPPSCIVSPHVNAEVEPTLAAHPDDPKTLVAAWMQDPRTGPAVANVAASSRNGGKSWRTELVPGASQCAGGMFEDAADVWLSYGPDGTVYLSSLPLPHNVDPDFGPIVSRFTNDGRSWSDPVFIEPEPGFNDKEAVTADPVRAGTAYIVWNRGPNLACVPCDIYFSRTDDEGRTWSDPVPITDSAAASPLEAGQVGEVIATGRGRLVVIISTQVLAPGLPVKFLALRSNDGGRTWSAPTEIGEAPFMQFVDPETATAIRYGPHLFTADGGPDRRIYVAWQAPTSSTSSKLLFSSSENGKQWTKPRVVSKGAVAPFAPDIAVARDGTVGLRFYDLRDDRPGDAALTTDSWFRHSHDGGKSWKEAQLGRGFNLRTAPVAGGGLPGYQLGEYQGLISLKGGFATAFARAKPAAKEGATDIFFAEIAVKGACEQAKKKVKKAKKKLKKAKKRGRPAQIKKAKKKLKKAKKRRKKACA